MEKMSYYVPKEENQNIDEHFTYNIRSFIALNPHVHPNLRLRTSERYKRHFEQYKRKERRKLALFASFLCAGNFASNDKLFISHIFS